MNLGVKTLQHLCPGIVKNIYKKRKKLKKDILRKVFKKLKSVKVQLINWLMERKKNNDQYEKALKGRLSRPNAMGNAKANL